MYYLAITYRLLITLVTPYFIACNTAH